MNTILLIISASVRLMRVAGESTNSNLHMEAPPPPPPPGGRWGDFSFQNTPCNWAAAHAPALELFCSSQ
eukprot:jgi/Botrbrau1/8758/Bobra.0090s0030.1